MGIQWAIYAGQKCLTFGSLLELQSFASVALNWVKFLDRLLLKEEDSPELTGILLCNSDGQTVLKQLMQKNYYIDFSDNCVHL